MRTSEEQLVGRYVGMLSTGREEIVLSPDRSFTQSFSSKSRQLVSRGTWKVRNEFLGGTVIELHGANLSEIDDAESSTRIGVRILNVQRHQGKIRLVLNEAADWYYDQEN